MREERERGSERESEREKREDETKTRKKCLTKLDNIFYDGNSRNAHRLSFI